MPCERIQTEPGVHTCSVPSISSPPLPPPPLGGGAPMRINATLPSTQVVAGNPLHSIHHPPLPPMLVHESSQTPRLLSKRESRALQGISSHFEDTRSFGDAIMTISLINPIYMTLKKPSEATNQCQDILAETKVLLRPRSCLIMSGDSRFRCWCFSPSNQALIVS